MTKPYIRKMSKEKEEEPPPKGKPMRENFLRYLRPYRHHLIRAVLLSASIALLNLCPPQIIRYIINEALPKGESRFLFTAVGILVILFSLRSLFVHLRIRLVGRMGQGIASNLRRDLFFHIQRLSLGFFDHAKIGKLLSRITNDTTYVTQFFTEGSHTLVVAVLTFTGVTIFCFYMNWQLTLFAMLPVPILGLLISRYSRTARKVYRAIRRQWGTFSARISDDLGGIREVKSFAREEHEDGRFGREDRRAHDLGIRVANLSAAYEPIIIFLSSLGTILVVGLGGWFVLRGEIRAGELVAFLLYLGLLYQPIWQMNSLVNLWEHARAAGEHIFKIMSIPQEVYQPPQALRPQNPLKGDVKFEKVSFSYKGRKPMLKEINLEARRDEHVALVGPTGSGKTTLLNLLPRFYDVNKGRILIDGQNIQQYDLTYLRNNIGIVLQDPFLFIGSIKENILYGRPEAPFEEIVRVAKAANIDQFIERLPMKYDSQVGERGVQLSGGEKQRIAIARVFLKDPPIVILDEATSSLDSETEMLVQKAIERLMKGRVTFVIAHRLSTVKNADKILVLKEGEIVERGTHKELLPQGGLYARLYKLQFEKVSSSVET